MRPLPHPVVPCDVLRTLLSPSPIIDEETGLALWEEGLKCRPEPGCGREEAAQAEARHGEWGTRPLTWPGMDGMSVRGVETGDVAEQRPPRPCQIERLQDSSSRLSSRPLHLCVCSLCPLPGESSEPAVALLPGMWLLPGGTGARAQGPGESWRILAREAGHRLSQSVWYLAMPSLLRDSVKTLVSKCPASSAHISLYIYICGDSAPG